MSLVGAISPIGRATRTPAASPLISRAGLDNVKKVAAQSRARAGREHNESPARIARIGVSEDQSPLLESLEPSKTGACRNAGRNARARDGYSLLCKLRPQKVEQHVPCG